MKKIIYCNRISSITVCSEPLFTNVSGYNYKWWCGGSYLSVHELTTSTSMQIFLLKKFFCMFCTFCLSRLNNTAYANNKERTANCNKPILNCDQITAINFSICSIGL